MKKTQSKIKAPKWDLSSIYSSVEGEDFRRALKNLEKGFNAMQKSLLDNKKDDNFPLWLKKTLMLHNETGALYQSLLSYANAAYTTDTTNTQYLNAVSVLQEKGLKAKELDRSFRAILTAHAQELDKFYTSFPQHEKYRFILEEAVKAQKHQMSDKEESVANDLQRFGADAWSRLQEQIISNAVDTETGKTFNELRNEAYAAERKIRKTAYEKETALLKQNEIAFAASLNNLKAATISLNKRRGWKEAIERSLFECRMSRKTLDALIGAMEDALPMWRSYMKTKAKLLGIEKCAFYDIFAPLKAPQNKTKGTNPEHGSEPHAEKVWTFNEAKKYIIERFSSFSEDMGNFARHAFEHNWIDAQVRRGKVGGAYCTDFPFHKVTRVLSNFTGTFSDVTTLAHELGHAYHGWCVKDLDYPQTLYPMTLAETASIFAETIVMKDQLSKTSGFERAKLIEMHLSDGNQVLVDILCRFYFERSVFEERSKSELSAADFCRLMARAQNDTYGNGLSKERHPYMWAVKSHYYIPELDFYNFPYAFGQLFALALYARFEKEGSSFPEVYTALLKDTGSYSCETVCRKAGFNIESKDFWAQGIRVFAEELKELKAYAASLKK
ncbi:M3 family oligoendopeptidase [Treponema sp. OMZ 840]|uniref:M3 family oligoendopeptidase n=1 Tax=Treponema sp. OMZ 840 TaxID=244313 RepID=UPI003D92B1C7